VLVFSDNPSKIIAFIDVLTKHWLYISVIVRLCTTDIWEENRMAVSNESASQRLDNAILA